MSFIVEGFLIAAGVMLLHQGVSHVYATWYAKQALDAFQEAQYRLHTDPEPQGDILYYVRQVKKERGIPSAARTIKHDDMAKLGLDRSSRRQLNTAGNITLQK
jgi:hypothetical protein